MVLERRAISMRRRIALILPLALLTLILAACDSDDPSDTASNGASAETAESDDGTTTETQDEPQNEDDEADSNDDDQESEGDSVAVEGATEQQQERIDSGKPTLLILAPEPGADVTSPMRVRFDVHNGEIVENSADEDGYVIFVTLGKSSSLIPIYGDEGEIRMVKNGRTKVTAMLGGQKGPIKKTAVSIKVKVSGIQESEGPASGGDSS